MIPSLEKTMLEAAAEFAARRAELHIDAFNAGRNLEITRAGETITIETTRRKCMQMIDIAGALHAEAEATP